MHRIALALVIAAGSLRAADYFPLEVGNKWEYTTSDSNEQRTGEVLSSETIDGRQWFQVRWLNGKDYWLRYEIQKVVELDRSKGEQSTWIDFSGLDGAQVD